MQFVRYIFLIFTLSALSACTITIKNISLLDYNTPAHVIYASQYLGFTEKTNRSQLHRLTGVDPMRTEWCAAFINAVLEKNNIAGSNSLAARSFLKWGKKTNQPQIGDIVVFARGNNNWQGHVGFYLDTVKYNNKIYYKILGGNQDDKVSIMYYPKKLLIETRKIKTPPKSRAFLNNKI